MEIIRVSTWPGAGGTWIARQRVNCDVGFYALVPIPAATLEQPVTHKPESAGPQLQLDSRTWLVGQAAVDAAQALALLCREQGLAVPPEIQRVAEADVEEEEVK